MTSAKFQNCFVCVILEIQRVAGKQSDPDEAAHREEPHLDLPCLQLQLFSLQMFLVFTCSYWKLEIYYKHCVTILKANILFTKK